MGHCIEIVDQRGSFAVQFASKGHAAGQIALRDPASSIAHGTDRPDDPTGEPTCHCHSNDQTDKADDQRYADIKMHRIDVLGWFGREEAPSFQHGVDQIECGGADGNHQY